MQARDISDKTRKLFDIRANMSRSKHTLADFDRVQAHITKSSMQDLKDWVERNVKEMEQANECGDISRIYELLRNLSDSPKPPPQNLTTDEKGNLLKSSEELVEVLFRFLKISLMQLLRRCLALTGLSSRLSALPAMI